jgi:hypothetical protein
MFDYLQQFNKLPRELRDRVSSPAAMEILSSLEKKYNLSLAMLVMQVMIKQVPIRDLTSHLITEMSLSSDRAQSLSQELQDKIFFAVSAYLGLKISPPLTPEDAELQVLMKDNAVVLPSQDLMARCRQILLTYRKGVRTKIDARFALEKAVVQGGLGLDPAAADRLLRALDRPVSTSAASASVSALAQVKIPTQTPPPSPSSPSSPSPSSPPLPSSSALNALIDKNEASTYDLKAAITSGQVKPPAALVKRFQAPRLDTKHELSAPVKDLALEAPKPLLDLPSPHKIIPADKPIITSPTPVSIPASTTNSSPIKTTAPILAPVIKSAPEPANLPVSKPPLVAVPPILKPVEKIKADPLVVLKPTESSSNSFAPLRSSALKSSLWSKLFKGKVVLAPTVAAGVGVISTNHLAEAVREATKNTVVSSRPAAFSESRPRMDDVKPRPKVMGPLEELRFLDLVNFRRLGANPKEITSKIVSRIKLLEKDGYDRMVEGVKAWRQSPVNRIYVRLAQESVANGRTLRETIAARQAEHKETLSMEEIEAIVSMNSQLMF